MTTDRHRGASDFAAELEIFAIAILELPGVSRRDPAAILEAKRELAGRLRNRANELRRRDGSAITRVPGRSLADLTVPANA